jgi:hypothetical protein
VAIVADRSNGGWGPEGDVRAAVLEQVGEPRPGRGLDRQLQAVVARGERVDQRANVFSDDGGGSHAHQARLARRVLYRAAGLLGQPEDLPGEHGQTPPAVGERDTRPSRTNNSSPSSLRSAATATETAGSVTSSSAAAAFTEPCRATSTNDCSCASVIGLSDSSGVV